MKLQGNASRKHIVDKIDAIFNSYIGSGRFYESAKQKGYFSIWWYASIVLAFLVNGILATGEKKNE